MTENVCKNRDRDRRRKRWKPNIKKIGDLNDVKPIDEVNYPALTDGAFYF